MDVLFLLDTSSSLRDYFAAEKSYIKTIVQQMQLGVSGHHVALVQFAGPSMQKAVFGFDEYRSGEDLVDALDEIQFSMGKWLPKIIF